MKNEQNVFEEANRKVRWSFTCVKAFQTDGELQLYFQEIIASEIELFVIEEH